MLTLVALIADDCETHYEIRFCCSHTEASVRLDLAALLFFRLSNFKLVLDSPWATQLNRVSTSVRKMNVQRASRNRNRPPIARIPITMTRSHTIMLHERQHQQPLAVSQALDPRRPHKQTQNRFSSIPFSCIFMCIEDLSSDCS